LATCSRSSAVLTGPIGSADGTSLTYHCFDMTTTRAEHYRAG
jgi:hypothetical protein